MSDPLSIWIEKKQFLETQLAITSDPSQKFTLQKQIQECEQEIERLQNQAYSHQNHLLSNQSNQPNQVNFDNQIPNNPATHLPSQTQQSYQPHPALQSGQPQQPPQQPQTHQAQQPQPNQPQLSIPTINFNNPTIIDIGVSELKALIPRVEILLLTVNDWERKALLSEMTPIDGKDGILQGALDRLTYRIGMFGNYCAAYTESTMGSGGRHGATLIAKIAVDELKPKAVLLLGIAFGIDSSKQKLGDVLIAESIQPYEFQKVHNDFSITYRGQATPCGNILSERFRMRRSDWTPKYGDKSFDDVKVYQGLVLSGDKLVNNKDFRDALVKAFPTAIGGEMEGAGAYSAVSSPVEVILIKSICDWADGDKNDMAQPFAAFTATSLAKHILSKPDVLFPLIINDNQTLENNQNIQNNQNNQNSADKTNASINQTVEAKHNSSVSGVVQAHSINNSTINNIYVDNRVDKDGLSSKTNQNKKPNNLPARNRFFTGRVDVLNKLDELIKSNQQVAIKQAISGMGGVGKTQTALEFCHQHINDYQTILWINAEDESSFNNSYLDIVYLLGLVKIGNPKELKHDDIILFVKSWLITNSNWLMVLDNLEDPKLIKKYIPPNPKGHILITTRSSPIDHAAIVPLNKMSLDTATLFLIKRAYPDQVDINAQNLQEINIDSSLLADAQQLTKAIDGLPLALKQAAAFIQESKCSLSDYLGFYQQALTDNQANDLGDHPSVFATFSLAFNNVKRESVTAAKLLEVCSFLDSELIPEEIFTSAGNLLGDELTKLQDNTYEFNNCLKVLLSYSLIERDTNNKSLSIHRLVQSVIRESISKDGKKSLIDSLTKTLNSLCPPDTEHLNNWPTFQRLLPSVLNLLTFSEEQPLTFHEAYTLFHQMGFYSLLQTLYPQSLNLLRSALDIFDITPLLNLNDKAATLNNIGMVHDCMGNYTLALDHYERALYLTKLIKGEQHPDTAKTLNNIGETHRKQQNHSLALNAMKKALDIYENNPKCDRYAAETSTNIVNLLLDQDPIQEPLDVLLLQLEKNLSIIKLHQGECYITNATIFNLMGLIYLKQENEELALDSFKKAFYIAKSFLKGKNPIFPLILNNLGLFYAKQNQHNKAKMYWTKSISLLKLIYNTDTVPEAVNPLRNLAIFYKNIGNEAEATTYNQRAFMLEFNLYLKILIMLFLVFGLSACESQEQTKKSTKKADSNTISSSATEDEYGNVSATNGNYNTNYKTQREFAAKVIGIIDGDTIEVLENNRPVRIRLAEIDCPESHQDFGQKAKTFTSELAFDKDVKVLVKDIDRYGRTVAEVILPDGRSLNRELISAGLAWWYQRYSSDQSLGQLQSQAKSAKLGLWSSDNPIPPWDFRHSR